MLFFQRALGLVPLVLLVGMRAITIAVSLPVAQPEEFGDADFDGKRRCKLCPFRVSNSSPVFQQILTRSLTFEREPVMTDESVSQFSSLLS